MFFTWIESFKVGLRGRKADSAIFLVILFVWWRSDEFGWRQTAKSRMITNSDISYLMDERNRQNKYSIKISIESRKSNLSSCRSLERPSWSSRHRSINKNHSLIEVMSLQSNRKSDIYEKMLEEDKPLQRQSLGGIVLSNYSYTPFEQQLDKEIIFNQRKSQQPNQTNISHTCKCYTDCEWETCPCLEAKNELCIQGYCCQGCIQSKAHYLLSLRLQAEEQDKIFCTCKKTKCNKKYCSCFAAGIMCGHRCTCEGCINCPRKSENGMDVEEEGQQITEEQLAAMDMPERMQFEPFIYGRISI